jgi:hypothetical protein
LAKGLSVLLIFAKKPVFFFIDSLYCSFTFHFVNLSPDLCFFCTYCFYVCLFLVFLIAWDELLGYLFEISLIFNVDTHSYKLSSQHYLFWVPKVAINCVFIFICFLNFFISSLISLMIHWSFKSELFNLHMLEYFV